MAEEFANKWAILFGCKGYENKNLATLDYPINDVIKFKEALQQYLEFPGDHFLEFGDGLQHAPELSTFWDRLRAFLKSSNVGEDDLLFFYFTGHGFRLDEEDYLLPQKASLHDPENTGIAVEKVIKRLLESRCKNIVMFLDACRNPVGTKALGAKGIGDQSARLMEKNQVLGFFSCQPEEQSWEIEKPVEHSSFTYCVLEALREAKCTTAGEMDEYLVREVQLLNDKYQKGPQKPYSKIVPFDRGKLPIFASKVKRKQETDEYSKMIEILQKPYFGGELDERYYDGAVDLLIVVRDKERELDPIEKMKLYWIRKLCGGRVKTKIFMATWDGLERQKLPVSGAVT